jgi:hypothetical protein
MVAAQKDIEGTDLTTHVRREEQRRRAANTLTGPLPDELRLADEQFADWMTRWPKATRGAPVTFDEARAAASAFIDPVLQDHARGKRWVAARQRWD